MKMIKLQKVEPYSSSRVDGSAGVQKWLPTQDFIWVRSDTIVSFESPPTPGCTRVACFAANTRYGTLDVLETPEQILELMKDTV